LLKNFEFFVFVIHFAVDKLQRLRAEGCHLLDGLLPKISGLVDDPTLQAAQSEGAFFEDGMSHVNDSAYGFTFGQGERTEISVNFAFPNFWLIGKHGFAEKLVKPLNSYLHIRDPFHDEGNVL
jgi:hypothetical protein